MVAVSSARLLSIPFSSHSAAGISFTASRARDASSRTSGLWRYGALRAFEPRTRVRRSGDAARKRGTRRGTTKTRAKQNNRRRSIADGTRRRKAAKREEKQTKDEEKLRHPLVRQGSGQGRLKHRASKREESPEMRRDGDGPLHPKKPGNADASRGRRQMSPLPLAFPVYVHLRVPLGEPNGREALACCRCQVRRSQLGGEDAAALRGAIQELRPPRGEQAAENMRKPAPDTCGPPRRDRALFGATHTATGCLPNGAVSRQFGGERNGERNAGAREKGTTPPRCAYAAQLSSCHPAREKFAKSVWGRLMSDVATCAQWRPQAQVQQVKARQRAQRFFGPGARDDAGSPANDAGAWERKFGEFV
ncbi:hypothetical protein BESB_061670 [Besnoitia besnoiti]|uniref:Uncharacterized protein n=1 Tax=Besnoitia besnoiti TaxID=94643 RepID=A0A2A9MIQ1_BESBE|nr:hypothetical protein BESB_061670 [Besnoitia besnoiti]PFH35280.1 hypothetical protein BESB_061670 [Besnoitia besnoiti]